MKRDCGGAAGVLGAFRLAVSSGFSQNLHAVFCLAENAVGPLATRPDDIHTLYSGRTVEINNTDAEGRLVLGDGVAYAQKDLKADIILDMATLTGAQVRPSFLFRFSLVAFFTMTSYTSLLFFTTIGFLFKCRFPMFFFVTKFFHNFGVRFF